MDWDRTVNIIRGKSLMYPKASGENEINIRADVDTLFCYIDLLETGLDEVDENDGLGTEGWRHYLLGED